MKTPSLRSACRFRGLLASCVLVSAPLLSQAQVDTSTVFNGTATHYVAGGSVASGIPEADRTNFYAAVDLTRYGNSEWCGAWLEVTGPSGTTEVQVIDKGDLFGANNLDLSYDAYQAIGGPTATGPLPVSWRLVSAPGAIGPVKFYSTAGSSIYYIGVRPVNVVNPVATVEIEAGGGFVTMTRNSDYSFIATPSPPLSEPFSIRLTDVFGNQFVSTGLTLEMLETGQAGSGNFPPAGGVAIEYPANNEVGDGGTRDLGYSVDGAGNPVVFTIRNTGAAPLNISSITVSGANPGDFTVTSSPSGTIAPGGLDSFEVTFASATAGARTADLTIASDVMDPGLASYVIHVTGTAVSSSNDGDGDGLNDAAEVLLADLGFDWQVAQNALVDTYYDSAEKAGLFTTSQVRALHVDTPLLERDPVGGTFTLTLGLGKSIDLTNFSPFPFQPSGMSVNGSGELEFEFTSGDDAAFLRVEAD